MMSLEKSTADKLCKYKEALGCFGGVRQSTSFWDVVVVTARDETQKRIYERQISLKKERREIPHFVQYVVISDPPGVKVGSGGSTLHCLQELLGTVGADALNNFKVILIHAGGYSQRLPNQSVLGKVFLTLPCDQLPIQMLDALLMMYVDIPEKMNPGVFVVSSDVIFLYNSEGEWNFRGLGFTAIAHPAPVRVADNHGVFILEDMLNPWESYRKDPSSPSAMAKPKCFVHKQTVESLQNKKAIIPGTDLAYVDLAFYFDTPTMHKLVKFYSENSPLQCEVDAYGDFLQALGPGATAKYCWETSSGKLARQQAVLREKLFNVLKETPLRVVIFHEAQFNHLGTIAEYLYHLCDNCILRRAYNFNIKSVHEERREGYGSCKVKTAEISSSEGYVLMQSVVHDTQSLSVGVKTVIEYCILERGVSIGRKCLLSNLHVPENSVIPENTFIHTVAVEIDHTIAYATCVFDVHDVVKKTSPKSSALELHFLHVPLGSALNMESAMNMLWPQNDECNLWTAKLFPVCSSRKESCAAAIKIISGVQRKCLQDVLGQYSQLVSMEDLLILKSGTSMLAFHEELRSSSIN